MSDRRNSLWTPRRAVAAFATVLSFAFVVSQISPRTRRRRRRRDLIVVGAKTATTSDCDTNRDCLSTGIAPATIKNKGKAPLQVIVGTLALPFKIISGSGTINLPKGKTQKVTVQFNPTATGVTAPQTLTISSDDPKHPSHNVTASGSGK